MNRKRTFESQKFARQYHYDGPLGCFCSDGETLFRLWAPTAESVTLCLYERGDGEHSPERIAMEPGKRGTWQVILPGNLHGCYYTYDVTVDGVTNHTADPYARACGVNGRRSMAVDLRRTNPEGWETDCAPARPAENIIYETHVGDFSGDPASGVAPQWRGKYPGLWQEGTTLNNDGVHPTGIDYLKSLGVTHVELMPIYDFGSVDEAGNVGQYNWGYDPVNYNVPEGSYSTDPFHGEVRIRELKQAIAALHRNGFRVIMDVVYNHTYHRDSWLNRTVPDYYYRQYGNGTWSNGSGCGNDTASERSMCGQYILDSILYWAEEYHMDGFRFDLMGLLPVELMNRIRQALDARFGAGEKLLFGEPWSAGATAVKKGTLLADKGNLKLLDRVGAFCDSTRDAVKGSLMNESSRGFVNGGTFWPGLLQACLRGWAGMDGDFSVNTPLQTIGYVSSHDDWTLWDRLVNTVGSGKNYTVSDAKVLQANRLAAAILCGCQGNVFLLSGEEFGRTKQGIKNTYASPLTVNRLDWVRAWENKSLKEYYQGLFALRRQLPCLCDKSEYAAERIRSFREVASGCAVAELEDPAENACWHHVALIYNTGSVPCRVELDGQRWQILATGTDSFCWKQGKETDGSAVVPPLSAMILGR